MPAPGAMTLTVAVKVTVWPKNDGLSEDVKAVLVPAWLVVCVTVPLLLTKLVSPP